VASRVAGEPAFWAGHADLDESDPEPVVDVAELFETGGPEPVGLVRR